MKNKEAKKLLLKQKQALRTTNDHVGHFVLTLFEIEKIFGTESVEYTWFNFTNPSFGDDREIYINQLSAKIDTLIEKVDAIYPTERFFQRVFKKKK